MMLKPVKRQQSIAKPAVEDPAIGWFRNVIAAERDALSDFLDRAPASGLDKIVKLVAGQAQPIVCTGVGKSGLVAAKVASTFSSLGTPAFFLNAAEAAHGDLGAVQKGNVVLCFSNSGSTEELLRILPLLKARSCHMVGIIGRVDSPLARGMDDLIPVTVAHEADHIGMAPTSSTTLQMAVGDALAVAVSRARAFSREDFLRHHPAGLLGRHMIPVRHLMRTGDALPTILPHASAAEMLSVISAKRMGAACVTDWNGKLLGLVVDGDIRRLVQDKRDLYSTMAGEIMQADPRIIRDDATVADALALMQAHAGRFVVLPVVDDDGILQGMLHTYDLMQQG